MKPSPFLLDGIGLWAQIFGAPVEPNRPALFLDRDGVLVEEMHFLSRRQDVRLSGRMGAAIARANAARIPVILVTNQSGIARGHFTWAEFLEVQAEIVSHLEREGAALDAVFACGFHASGNPPLDVDQQGWRKPAPGMLFAARDRLGVDLSRSAIVGDRISDIEAGHNAGLASGALVMTGYGADHAGRVRQRISVWADAGYSVTLSEEPSDAVDAAVARLTG